MQDGGTPPKTGQTTLVLNIEHNLNPPVFPANTDCNYTISEDQALNEVFGFVQASDSDTKVQETKTLFPLYPLYAGIQNGRFIKCCLHLWFGYAYLPGER